MSDTRELCEKAVAELRSHGGFPALADFLEATLAPPEVLTWSEPVPPEAAALDATFAASESEMGEQAQSGTAETDADPVNPNATL